MHFRGVEKKSLLTCFSEASVEDMLPKVYVDAPTTKFYLCKLFLVVPFLAHHDTFWEGFSGTAIPTRKAVLEETSYHRGLDLASCSYLVRASKFTINQLMWPLPMIILDSLMAWRSHVCTRRLLLEPLDSWAQLRRESHVGVLEVNFLPSIIGVLWCPNLSLVVLERLAFGHVK
jgi:hypothetical protein